METTITPKRKAPTKAEAMKALIELERKLMIKENEEAAAAKQLALEELKQATVQYVLENLDALKTQLHVDANFWRLKAGVGFNVDSKDKDDGGLPMPPHLKKLHKKWNEAEERPNGYNVEHLAEKEIRKRIEDKLKRISPDAVINGANCAQVERTPVVKEYLTEFLASLTKASKAAERLAA
jgi:hypothetical protein